MEMILYLVIFILCFFWIIYFFLRAKKYFCIFKRTMFDYNICYWFQRIYLPITIWRHIYNFNSLENVSIESCGTSHFKTIHTLEGRSLLNYTDGGFVPLFFLIFFFFNQLHPLIIWHGLYDLSKRTYTTVRPL